jgi:predicted DCC family thiol-disulfide oxidoreductase YuxK
MPDTSRHSAVLATRDETALPLPDRIVLFDGICGFCNLTVDFLLRRDPAGLLKFAPLQGSTATRLIPTEVRDRLDTMAYYRQGQVYYRTGAVVRVLRDLGGLWAALGTTLWLIPSPLRDTGYRCISAVRYRLFGQHDSCRMPTSEERDRFLE